VHAQAALNVRNAPAELQFFGPSKGKLWCRSAIETVHLWDWGRSVEEQAADHMAVEEDPQAAPDSCDIMDAREQLNKSLQSDNARFQGQVRRRRLCRPMQIHLLCTVFPTSRCVAIRVHRTRSCNRYSYAGGLCGRLPRGLGWAAVRHCRILFRLLGPVPAEHSWRNGCLSCGPRRNASQWRSLGRGAYRPSCCLQPHSRPI
jgi:hypothetical protein